MVKVNFMHQCLLYDKVPCCIHVNFFRVIVLTHLLAYFHNSQFVPYKKHRVTNDYLLRHMAFLHSFAESFNDRLSPVCLNTVMHCQAIISVASRLPAAGADTFAFDDNCPAQVSGLLSCVPPPL